MKVPNTYAQPHIFDNKQTTNASQTKKHYDSDDSGYDASDEDNGDYWKKWKKKVLPTIKRRQAEKKK